MNTPHQSRTQLEFETKSAEFLPSDKVKWYTVALPAKLAPQWAALSDALEVRDLLDAEIVAILKAIQEEIR